MSISYPSWENVPWEDFEISEYVPAEIDYTAMAILNTGLGLAQQAISGGLPTIDLNVNDINDVVFPDPIQGFGDDAVSFANALAAFEGYLSTLPTMPTEPDLTTTSTTPPTISDSPELTDVVVDEFLQTAPDLNFGAVPEYTEIASPSTPTIESPYTPARPDIIFPSLPSLTDVTLPSPTAVEVPQFTAVFEDDELLAPSYIFSFSEPDYASSLKDLVYNKFSDEIQTGGYGIEPADEEALWNRERDRENVNAQIAIEEIRRNYGVSGFSLPPGALNKALERANLAILQKNSSVNRDIAIKRSELYLEGKKFVLSQSIELEKLLMNFWSAKYERVLNAAKAQVEMAVAIYNAQIARYNAKVAKYRAEAEIFESRIRAEIAKVEIFKAQIEGAKVQSELQKNQVLLYNAQVDGVKSIIEAYKVDVEAANLLMKREELRMQVYKAEVDAYSAMVAAEKYRFDAYESRVKGELGRVQAYEAEARAYAALIEGKKAQVDVNRLRLQQWSEENRAYLDIYKAQIDENREIRDIQSKVFEMDVRAYDASLNRFTTQVTGLTKIYDLGQAALEKTYRVQIAALQTNIETAKLQLQRLIAILEAQSRLGIGELEAAARLQSASMNILNLNASVGNHFSRSISNSQSQNYSFNRSQSESYSHASQGIWSYNHNWNHEAD